MATRAGNLSVRIETEEEFGRGWRYRALVSRDGEASEHAVTLSWADHEYWCGGRLPPSALIECVIRYVAARREDLPARFDAATCRRWFRDLDRDVAQAGE
jgi:hypothetical protein